MASLWAGFQKATADFDMLSRIDGFLTPGFHLFSDLFLLLSNL
jgi:hypothetical protein